MPHLILEYSSNITETEGMNDLFMRLHKALSDEAGIDIGNCKSRAYEARYFRVGRGEENDAFVHLDVRFLSGRTSDVKQTLGRAFLDILIEWFAASTEALALQITVEICDIDRGAYFKHPAGTLSTG